MIATDDMKWLVDLAEDIGSDGAVPCDDDINEVVSFFNAYEHAEVWAIIKKGLTDAAEFYAQVIEFRYDPRGAFDSWVDEGTYSHDAAAYWETEFARRGRDELQTMIDRVKAAL
jgi:hypothetical protein